MGKRNRAFSVVDLPGTQPSHSADPTSSQPPSKRTAIKVGKQKSSTQATSNVSDNSPVAGPSHPSQSTASYTNHRSVDDVIDVVICGRGGRPTMDGLQAEICDLKGTISQQALTIAKLTRQVSSMLSYLELSEIDLTATAPSVGVDQVAVAFVDTGTSSSASDAVVGASASADSWTVVGGRRKSSARHSTVVAAAVAAVYCDAAEKNRRAASMIITGLPQSTLGDDKGEVVRLCRTYLDADVDVVHTKRLGRVMPERQQPLPLLVVLNSPAAAQGVLSVARRLRQSADPYIRDRVYINPNRTKAESEAAFRMRELRRQAVARRSGRGENQVVHPPAVHQPVRPVVAVHPPPLMLPLASSSSLSAPFAAVGGVAHAAGASSSLNVAATSFSRRGDVVVVGGGGVGNFDVAQHMQHFVAGPYQSAASNSAPVNTAATSDGRPA